MLILPKGRRRATSHSERTEECLDLHPRSTAIRTNFPSLSRAFPGSCVGFWWVFLSRVRHTWVAVRGELVAHGSAKALAIVKVFPGAHKRGRPAPSINFRPPGACGVYPDVVDG